MDPTVSKPPSCTIDPGIPAATDPPGPALVHFRLYLAPPAPTSTRASANLGAILLSLGASAHRVSIETIDVVANPLRALKDRVIVTPTLMVCGMDNVSPPIIGDLSDTRLVRSFIDAALAQAVVVPEKSPEEP